MNSTIDYDDDGYPIIAIDEKLAVPSKHQRIFSATPQMQNSTGQSL